ncbi:MAG: glucose-6-phosphate dehydrogenase [Alphaproteobacteria bacterium]|nr:glucose-6-phosphate dehydrogenase [Alphaproteobacteria bacterium]
MTALDIVIFGGSGDLCLRKLMPAFYFLKQQGKLPENSRILALSRGRISQNDFRTRVLDKLKIFLGASYDETQAQAFVQGVTYMPLDIPDDSSWDGLVEYLSPVDDRDIIYYMAVPPTLFGTVCAQLRRTGLNPANSRLVVEKPLGENQASAEEVNEILAASFAEKQIYRIDHYLGKPAVQNILAFRFDNGLIEHKWNRDHIDNVQITVAEMVGVENRAEFLDRTGILRDMIQNHLMQILCFVAMDAPAQLTADDVRDQKVKIVQALCPVTAADIQDHVVRAQYAAGEIDGRAVPGYLEEIDGRKLAATGETFIAVKAMIANDRWRGVPFYLRTGKRLSGRFARIVIGFRSQNGGTSRVIINIQPDMTICFDHEVITGQPTGDIRIPDAYEKLLSDVIAGDQSYFVRHDEIIASWQWIDGIRAAWTDLEMHTYAAGSMGPSASDDLLAAGSNIWYED